MVKNGTLEALALSALLFICTGCSNDRNMEPTALPPSATAIAAAVEVADTATPRPSSTATPSAAPTETATAIATATSTPSPLPPPTVTPTAFPTLSPEMAEAFLADFLLHGSECPLPCWWDAIPGQTSWVSIEPFLRSLTTDISRHGTAFMPPPLVGYWVTLNVPLDIHPLGHFVIGYLVNDGIIETISARLGTAPAYSLDTILSQYGPPSEVWLDTMSEPREGSLPFGLYLHYQQQGFFVSFREEATLVGERVIGCFEPDRLNESPYLFLWDPKQNLSYREVLERVESGDLWRFRLPLEEATGLSLAEFTAIYSDPANGLCIETPAELWVGH